jgi:hypothetical protein
MSVLELSVFLQPKHGAFNNGSQDSFVVCAVPLQHGPRLPLFLVIYFMFSVVFLMDFVTTNQQVILPPTQLRASKLTSPGLEEGGTRAILGVRDGWAWVWVWVWLGHGARVEP